jgi:hypothetical protein
MVDLYLLCPHRGQNSHQRADYVPARHYWCGHRVRFALRNRLPTRPLKMTLLILSYFSRLVRQSFTRAD